MSLAAPSVAHIAKDTPNCFKYFTFFFFLSVLSGERFQYFANGIPRRFTRYVRKIYVGLRNDLIQDVTIWVRNLAD